MRPEAGDGPLDAATRGPQQSAVNIADFIDQSLSAEASVAKSHSLGVVEPAMAKQLATIVGEPVDGYTHIIDNFAVRHMLREHGNPKKEAARGQIAITTDDIERIPEVLAAPDRIENAGDTRQGRKGVRYVKALDGVLFYVEEVRSGRKQLAAVTLYKKKSGTPDARP